MQVKKSLKKLGPHDSLKLQKMGKCAVEVAADKRRHVIRAITVELFCEACDLHNYDQQKMIKFLAKRRKIDDHTVSNYYIIFIARNFAYEFPAESHSS